MTSELTTRTRDAVTGDLSRKVLRYGELIEQTVRAAKQPGFTEAGWDELSALLDTSRFERVGNDRAVMDWAGYRHLLMQWAGATDFHQEFRRISEVGNLVFLELTETNTPADGAATVVNSLSLYEFDDAGRIVHLDIYLQHD